MQFLLTFSVWMPCWQHPQGKSPTSGRNKVRVEKPRTPESLTPDML